MPPTNTAMTKRLFRQDHPILFGFFILTGIFLMFWGGITFFLAGVIQPDRGDLFSHDQGIAILEVNGVIVSAKEPIKDLTSFRNNKEVKAIIVRIDSPGGAVGASQELFEEIRRTDKVKPVIASMGSVAASGGYYAALGCREIYANPGTITGSIGVILKFANLKELFEKIGYKNEVVKSGAFKDIGSSDRPMTDKERAFLQALIDNVHGQFIRAVAQQRKLDEEPVRELADGRIFSGEQAQALGLVDTLGNFTDAIDRAAVLAELDPQNPRLIYPKKEEFNLLKLLSEGNTAGSMLNNILNHYPVLAYQWAMPR
ncbi:MAG: signal peptide peptidase SppA [Desulfobulbaceae bacterium]|nr:signal peptide peptidase SppA [Desulfobulbaceae bacterium]